MGGRGVQVFMVGFLLAMFFYHRAVVVHALALLCTLKRKTERRGSGVFSSVA
jgi:hypothetical protein